MGCGKVIILLRLKLKGDFIPVCKHLYLFAVLFIGIAFLLLPKLHSLIKIMCITSDVKSLNQYDALPLLSTTLMVMINDMCK